MNEGFIYSSYLDLIRDLSNLITLRRSVIVAKISKDKLSPILNVQQNKLIKTMDKIKNHKFKSIPIMS